MVCIFFSFFILFPCLLLLGVELCGLVGTVVVSFVRYIEIVGLTWSFVYVFLIGVLRDTVNFQLKKGLKRGVTMSPVRLHSLRVSDNVPRFDCGSLDTT